MRAKADSEWQAEDDLRTMTHYHEICKDPKRKSAAQALAKKKLKDMEAVASPPAKK